MPASARFIDENGYLLVKGCPVSSYGIFDYSAAQVGETEAENKGDINRIVKVFRPEAAVSDPELIRSLQLVPLIDEHDYLTGDTSAMEAEGIDPGMDPSDKGVDGIMTDEVYYEAPWLRSDLKIFSRRAQLEMRKGKTDLSLGYVCRFEYAPGEYQGQPYEYIQTEMRGNHIALVGTGRVPGARVLDGLVFDSMSFTVPSTTTTRKQAMDQETAKGLMSSLDALCASHDTTGAAPAPGAAPAQAAAPAPGAEAGSDESELTHNEHEREAGAELGVDDVIAKLEETAKRLRESAGAEAHNAAERTGDEGGNNEVTVDNDNITGDEDPGLLHERERVGMERADKKTGDNVEGLADGGTAEIAADEAGSDEIVDASKGPGKGTPSFTGDAALRAFHADVATRDRLVAASAPFVGDFKASAQRMTAGDAALYIGKKLNVNVTRANAIRTVDAMLLGAKLERARAAKSAPVAVQRTGDGAAPRVSEIDAYFKK